MQVYLQSKVFIRLFLLSIILIIVIIVAAILYYKKMKEDCEESKIYPEEQIVNNTFNKLKEMPTAISSDKLWDRFYFNNK